MNEYVNWQRIRTRIHHKGGVRPSMIGAQYLGLYAVEMGATPAAVLDSETVALVWMEFTPSDGQPRVWSQIALPDPSEDYGGFKDPRVLSWGTVIRALSEERSGEFEGYEHHHRTERHGPPPAPTPDRRRDALFPEPAADCPHD